MGSGAAVVGFGAAVAGVGFGTAVVGVGVGFGTAVAVAGVGFGFGAAVVGVGLGLGAAVVGFEADAVGAFGWRDGSALPSFAAPVLDGLVVGVSDGTAGGSPCCRPFHRLYRSGPSHRSPAAFAAVRWSCRCPSPGQSVQAMATEGMPMTPTATAVTTVRRYRR
ncbi:hypothetical protein SHKM778_33530 [Streptomyces sp. KM77-8]|uniref:Uncharacterized protein n=1 Tax=Streptomyces haneummycinicus TaxID=3074435 RepID=A0AAT9HI20_9ACTN